jgi:hypothetical protein
MKNLLKLDGMSVPIKDSRTLTGPRQARIPHLGDYGGVLVTLFIPEYAFLKGKE